MRQVRDLTVSAVAEVSSPAKVATPGKLGLAALTAIVIGSMIGAGVFSLPQTMASGAAPLAMLIGWTITGIGVLSLALVYQNLAVRKPKLDSGPYAYAKAGFGSFVGFNAAWGYWLSVCLGNVSFAIVMFSALSYFFPVFGAGNTLPAIIGASVILWSIHAVTLFGIREASLVNLVTTFTKLVPIALFVVMVAVAFSGRTFTFDLRGLHNPSLGGLFPQLKSTMLVTLWVFVGIEGASVISARAARRKDVGVATLLGFFTCLVIYISVSLLSLGIISQPALAKLKNPSMAGVLGHIVGPWGEVLINVALVVSVLGAFLSWTMLAAEVPHVAARDGTMPRFLARENRRGAPAAALWVTNVAVQAILVVTLFASSTYQSMFQIAATARLIPYVLSGAYAAKLAIRREAYRAGETRTKDLIAGGVATIYGLWLVYAAGLLDVLLVALVYAAGIGVHVVARRERGEPIFTGIEGWIAGALLAMSVAAVWLLLK